MSKKVSLIISIFFLTALVSGCGTNTLVEKQLEKNLEKQLGGQANVNLGSGEVKIKTENGSLNVGDSVKLPNNFPDDVYVVDGRLLSAMENIVGQGTQIMVSTDKSVSDVSELYNKKLVDNGWVVESNMNLGEAYVLTATKDKRQVSLSVGTDDEGKTAVVLTVMTK